MVGFEGLSGFPAVCPCRVGLIFGTLVCSNCQWYAAVSLSQSLAIWLFALGLCLGARYSVFPLVVCQGPSFLLSVVM